MRLLVPAFEPDRIPSRYTADGANLSPAWEVQDVPERAVELVAWLVDPDAKGVDGNAFVHWVLWGLPAHRTRLPEGVPGSKFAAFGARQGKNDFGTLGYRGPDPPPGSPHRYVLTVAALIEKTGVPAGSHLSEILSALAGKVAAQVSMTGRFGR